MNMFDIGDLRSSWLMDSMKFKCCMEFGSRFTPEIFSQYKPLVLSLQAEYVNNLASDINNHLLFAGY